MSKKRPPGNGQTAYEKWAAAMVARSDMYYDRTGKAIDSETCSRKCGDPKYRRVAATVLPDRKLVSTIWIGLNGQSGQGPPVIFETAVFPSKKNFDRLWSESHSTEEEALEGHSV
jgi:hypothetical protein